MVRLASKRPENLGQGCFQGRRICIFILEDMLAMPAATGRMRLKPRTDLAQGCGDEHEVSVHSLLIHAADDPRDGELRLSYGKRMRRPAETLGPVGHILG